MGKIRPIPKTFYIKATGKNTIIKQESELKEGTPEYQASLVLDNLLNIERLKC